jgi:hypothetical protein
MDRDNLHIANAQSAGGRNAIVIGSSIAGMAAARVLTEHFDQVTVIERDALPSDVDFRNGVPQARHVHVLLMRGDQVVDASGRRSDAPQWLKAAGLPAPEETKINGFPGYATRFYRRPANFAGDWKVAYFQPTPPHNTRGAIIAPLEGDRWHVTLIGMSGDYPPTDEEGFLEFARSLPDPMIYDLLRSAEPAPAAPAVQAPAAG